MVFLETTAFSNIIRRNEILLRKKRENKILFALDVRSYVFNTTNPVMVFALSLGRRHKIRQHWKEKSYVDSQNARVIHE